MQGTHTSKQRTTVRQGTLCSSCLSVTTSIARLCTQRSCQRVRRWAGATRLDSPVKGPVSCCPTSWWPVQRFERTYCAMELDMLSAAALKEILVQGV